MFTVDLGFLITVSENKKYLNLQEGLLLSCCSAVSDPRPCSAALYLAQNVTELHLW